MKVVIQEYASMIVSLISTIGFLAIVGEAFLGQEGILAVLIYRVIGG